MKEAEDREGRLPLRPEGYYHEYVLPTPNTTGPGAQRIIRGQEAEIGSAIALELDDHIYIPLNDHCGHVSVLVDDGTAITPQLHMLR